MPEKTAITDPELFHELMKRAAQSPVPSHAPTRDADILRTQLHAFDKERFPEPTTAPYRIGEPLTVEQLNEAIGNLIPGGSGAQQAILAPNSMIRNPEARKRLHEMLMESAQNLPSHVQKALATAIQKHPRIYAHVPKVEKVPQRIDRPPTSMSGGFSPHLAPNTDPRGTLVLNPALKDYNAAEGTLVHEATHVAQMIKEAGKARRQGLPDPQDVQDTPFLQLYNTYQQLKGYWDNPLEVQARVAREMRGVSRKDMPAKVRRSLAEGRAMDKVRSDNRAEADLGVPAHDIRAQVDELINHAVATKKMDPLPLGGRVEVLPTSARQIDPTMDEVDALIVELRKRVK